MDEYTNKLYEDFKTKDVLDGITADNFDLLKNNAFIVPENKEFFEDMLRVGYLSGQISSSGPMPGTGVMIVDVLASAGQGLEILKANPGEVWSIIGMSYFVTGISGTINHVLYLQGEYSGAPAGSVTLSEKSSTDAADNFGDIDFTPLHIDENLSLNYTFFGTATNVTVRCAAIRVR
jgi:hypothetical protein